MALIHLENIQLQALPSHPLVGSAVVTYDAISDELAFWMGGDPRPHISEPANAFVSILFDLESGAAIGVRVENFLALAVHQHPELRAISDYLGYVPRLEGDTTLFSDRIVMVATPYEEDEAQRFKDAVKHIVDLTGGFDSDAFEELSRSGNT